MCVSTITKIRSIHFQTINIGSTVSKHYIVAYCIYGKVIRELIHVSPVFCTPSSMKKMKMHTYYMIPYHHFILVRQRQSMLNFLLDYGFDFYLHKCTAV